MQTRTAEPRAAWHPRVITRGTAVRSAAPAERRTQQRGLVTVPAVPRLVPSAAFAAVVVLLLCVGLVALLAINTAVAEDAFLVHELRQQSRAAADHEQVVEREVQALRAPEALAARGSALGLGLAPAASPIFLRLRDGALLGTASSPAAADVGARSDDGPPADPQEPAR